MAHKHFVLRRTNQHQGMFPQAIIITPPRGRADPSEVQTRTAYRSNMHCPMSLILHREGPIPACRKSNGNVSATTFCCKHRTRFPIPDSFLSPLAFRFPSENIKQKPSGALFLIFKNNQIWIESKFQRILAIHSGHFASRATGSNSTAATWTDTVLSATQSHTVFVPFAQSSLCTWEESYQSMYR
jgi:hypothetical protein